MKKLICVVLITCMLACLLPASSIQASAVAPSVEDILNDYHQKAFTAQVEAELNGAVAYGMRSGSDKSLEQETVDTLNAAGYEAYHVTGDNYYTLEEALKTDFSDMGLDPEGSYFVVISGEEPGSSSRIIPGPITPTLPPDPGGDGTLFEYTYNGKRYTMRYVTVTADMNSQLGRIQQIDLLAEGNAGTMAGALDLPITMLSSIEAFSGVMTAYSLISAVIPDIPPNQFQSLFFTGAANWTITYIQAYDFLEEKWQVCGGTEYVNLRYFIDFVYYDSNTNRYERKSTDGVEESGYSDYYYDKEMMKYMAAIAFDVSARFLDKVDYVEFKHGGKTVITIRRWHEYIGYEPA